MIGEIRDVETARIAVQASLTGHLVLAAVHTNDAVSAVTRLVVMGVEPFLLASTCGVLAPTSGSPPVPECRIGRAADAADREIPRCRMPADPLAGCRMPGVPKERLSRAYRESTNC